MNKLICYMGEKKTVCPLCLLGAKRRDPQLLVLTDSALKCELCGKESKIDTDI